MLTFQEISIIFPLLRNRQTSNQKEITPTKLPKYASTCLHDEETGGERRQNREPKQTKNNKKMNRVEKSFPEIFIFVAYFVKRGGCGGAKVGTLAHKIEIMGSIQATACYIRPLLINV